MKKDDIKTEMVRMQLREELFSNMNGRFYKSPVRGNDKYRKGKSGSFARVQNIMCEVYDTDKPLETIVPDTFGLDRFFICGFLGDELWYEFWNVFKEFIMRSYPKMKEFNKLSSLIVEDMHKGNPESSVKEYLFSYIYCAAKEGDEYSVALIKHLYKSFYKREYNQLKRFRKINAVGVFELATQYDDSEFLIGVARVIVMSTFFGVELDRDIAGLLTILNEAAENGSIKEGGDVLEYEEGYYLECLRQIDAWRMEEKYVEPRKYRRDKKFVEKCFHKMGFGPDYLETNDCDNEQVTFAHTLALLKLAYPKLEITFDEVQRYANLYRIVKMTTNLIKEYVDLPNVILGMEGRVLGCSENLFKPEKVVILSKSEGKEEVKPVSISMESSQSVDEADYKNEIAELRRKLREKDNESRYFRMQYEQTKSSLHDANELIEKYKNDREELISLRNHVYSLSVEEKEISEMDTEAMKKSIQSRKIVMVGGHTNFVNKMKKEFPEWKFYDANVTKTNELVMLDGTEKLYFFTDHMSHCVYSKYISSVRENKIPLGYIHTVNIKAIIKQIYDEFSY